jgi:hypothetical protein
LKIITIEHKNPHYIDLQYKTLQMHLKNEFEYVCYNNAHWNKENYKNINTICKNLKIESIDFDVSSPYFPGPSESHCDALIQIWKDYKNTTEKIVIINSDMFLIRDIDFEHVFGNKPMAIVPNYSVTNNHSMAIWAGLLFLDIAKIPNKNDFDMSLGFVDGERVDTGGKTRNYFKNNKVDINFLEFWSIEHYDQNMLHTNLNGNFQFKLDRKNKQSVYNKKTFDYELDRKDYNQYLYHNYEYILNKVEKYNFPRIPYDVQFIKLYNESIEDSFIFHQAGGSNYINNSEDYMKQRFEATRKLIGV